MSRSLLASGPSAAACQAPQLVEGDDRERYGNDYSEILARERPFPEIKGGASAEFDDDTGSEVNARRYSQNRLDPLTLRAGHDHLDAVDRVLLTHLPDCVRSNHVREAAVFECYTPGIPSLKTGKRYRSRHWQAPTRCVEP
jgi:hypothetical protein